MSILRKKGDRALTHHWQKRHDRDLVTRRRWKAWRAITQPRYTRDPIDRAFKGIVGRPGALLKERRSYRVLR